MTEGAPRIAAWARQLAALAQIGLEYSPSPYDTERYEAIREIAAAMLAHDDPARAPFILDLLRREQGYATPKVDVRGIIFRGDQILLVRESADGRWAPPGGWADVGERPSRCVEREVFEESGLNVRAIKLCAVYDRTHQGHTPELPFHVYKMFFLCEALGPEAVALLKPGHDILEARFFPLDALPELSLGRVLPAQISRMLQFRNDPALPADFD